MKYLGFGVLALAMAGTISGPVAAGGDGCCASKNVAKTPLLEKAEGVRARWETLAAKPVEFSEADKEACAKAKETLSQICPVCKQMPDTVGFLTQTMALATGLEKSCEEACKSNESAMKDIPAEFKAAMAERSALLKSSQTLLHAAFASFADEEGSKKSCGNGGDGGCCAEGKEGKEACAKDGKKACNANPECYAMLQKKADRLLAAWGGIPGKISEFTAEEKARLQSAMGTMMRLQGERCPLFGETIGVTASMLGRVVEIEEACAKACKEKAETSVSAKPACPQAEAFAARRELLKKTGDLLAKMSKVMNPETWKSVSMQASQ